MLCGLGSLECDFLGNIDCILFDIQIHWLSKWWEVEQWKDPVVAKGVVLVVLLNEGGWLVLIVFVMREGRGTYKAW